MESKFTWLNGKLVPSDQAVVPFMTTALHYGTAVFEGIRSYNTDRGPAIFRLRDHMQRLVDSAHVLGFRELPFDVDEMCQAARETVVANGFANCYVRPLIYQAAGGMNLNLDGGTVGAGIATWEWPDYYGPEVLEKGIRVNVSSFTRHHPNVMMTKAKISGNYANSVLARTESLRLGFDEAIMLDPSGFVAECSGDNLFLVRKGKIYTPPRATILEGITRDSLVTVARDAGYEVIEDPISRDQLYIADEVFMTGTAAEVAAVSEIDFRQIGSGKSGPVTRELHRAFHAAVRGSDPRYHAWLDYVHVPLAEAEPESAASMPL